MSPEGDVERSTRILSEEGWGGGWRKSHRRGARSGGGEGDEVVATASCMRRRRPVQDVADSCRTGAATNVIFGLALGYKSVIIPIITIAVAIYVSFSLAAMYGIAVAALGMLSTIATGLAIDASGPISDNAGGIAEMAGMSHSIRERTDALDAAGNTTAAIGKRRPMERWVWRWVGER
ncbi:hypothetical protein RJ640_000067, partial [Escallonia rubra]